MPFVRDNSSKPKMPNGREQLPYFEDLNGTIAPGYSTEKSELVQLRLW